MSAFEISCINLLLTICICEFIRLVFTLRSYIRSKKDDRSNK